MRSGFLTTNGRRSRSLLPARVWTKRQKRSTQRCKKVIGFQLRPPTPEEYGMRRRLVILTCAIALIAFSTTLNGADKNDKKASALATSGTSVDSGTFGIMVGG